MRPHALVRGRPEDEEQQFKPDNRQKYSTFFVASFKRSSLKRGTLSIATSTVGVGRTSCDQSKQVADYSAGIGRGGELFPSSIDNSLICVHRGIDPSNYAGWMLPTVFME